jgi:hypothetical protein
VEKKGGKIQTNIVEVEKGKEKGKSNYEGSSSVETNCVFKN